MVNIAIFASGSGTNAEAIARHLDGHPRAAVKAVVTNRASAGVHDRMRPLGVATLNFPAAEWRGDAPAIVKWLDGNNIHLIVLAGFLAFIPQSITDTYSGRIINIHPSLLPRHGGKGMYGHHVHQSVIDSGDTLSGITIHHVDNRFDHGAPILQACCPVLPDDTPDTLADRIHLLEHRHLPRIVERLAEQIALTLNL